MKMQGKEDFIGEKESLFYVQILIIEIYNEKFISFILLKKNSKIFSEISMKKFLFIKTFFQKKFSSQKDQKIFSHNEIGTILH